MQARYNITIATICKPSVTIATDDIIGVAQAVDKILASYARYVEPAEPHHTSQQLAVTNDLLNPVAPICAIHHKPMVGVNGKRGFFYSCHERMDDGSWCRYRPTR